MTTTSDRTRAARRKTPFILSLPVVVVSFTLVTAVRAEAATITFTSSAAFFSALGASPYTTETYEAPAVNTLIPDGTTLNGVTYLIFPPGTDGRIDDIFDSLGDHGLGLRDAAAPDAVAGFFLPSEGVTVAFLTPVNAIGIFFNANPSPSGTLQIVTTAGTAGNGPAYDLSTFYFVGLISDVSVTTATFRGIGPSGFTLDNMTFATTIPELDPLPLVMSGLMAAAVLSVKKGANESFC
jgi:hypothetical protein